MPLAIPKGLSGLKGLNSLSKQEYDAFVGRNKDLIAAHNYDSQYIHNLYSNKQFIDKFGIDQFKAIPNIQQRNALYEETVIKEEGDKLYSPFNPDGTRDNNKGLGTAWEKFSQMSPDAQVKLMESDYLSPSEFETQWQKQQKEFSDVNTIMYDRAKNPLFVGNAAVPGMENPLYGSLDVDQEAVKQLAKEKNQRIFDQIYNDDVDAEAKRYSADVNQAYTHSTLVGMSDDQVKESFTQAITPNTGNLGIAEYAKYFGDGTHIKPEMQDFSIDEMRQVLAKKAVYDHYMGPERAATALNNEAQRYAKEHQNSWRRFGLFAKDVGISALSYTMDKANSIYNLGLMAADTFGEKPLVWVDDAGNVISPGNIGVGTGGSYGTIGADGAFHPVHQAQIDRSTLHLMGKNADGTDDTSLLNPQYWTRAEQFGTLDKDLQEQYERLGSSPYKVAYDPNEDTDLIYEGLKMASFQIADGGSQLIPFGIGQVGKALQAASKLGKVAQTVGRAISYAGKALTAETKTGQVLQGVAGAGGISYAYERGAFQETLQQNLANAEQVLLDRSRNDIYERYSADKDYKTQMDAQIKSQADVLKRDYMSQAMLDGGRKIVDEEALDRMFEARAREQVMGEQVEARVKERKSSDEYAQLQEEAIRSAGETANTVFLPEAVKYGLINTVGWKKWMYSNPASLQKRAQQVYKGLQEVTTTTGRQRLALQASKFLTRGDKVKQLGKTLGSQVWGGSWTNGTDDMMVDGAERINEDRFSQYLNAYTQGEAMADTYGFADGLYSYWKGLNNSIGQETTLDATVVGGVGSLISASPNMTNIAHYLTKSGRQAFKERYAQKQPYDTDLDGFQRTKLDKDGKPMTTPVSWTENWRDRLNYFTHNGVLNTYYGKKINEQDLQHHADYVNNILDNYDDFKAVEDLLSADIGLGDAENVGDLKTMRFVKAIKAVDALNHLGNSKIDPASLSSVVQQKKDQIAKFVQVAEDPSKFGVLFSPEETKDFIAQYYANNPGVPQNEGNNRLAIRHIADNAKKLQEASVAYDHAEGQLQIIEKTLGTSIDPAVKARMKLAQALDGHWKDRLHTMKKEIGDLDSTAEPSHDLIIPSVGGRKNAEALVHVYERQQVELQKELEKQKKETQKKEESLQKDKENLAKAQNSSAQYTAQQFVRQGQAELEDARQQESYLSALIEVTLSKKAKMQQALDSEVPDAQGNYTTRILTSDEIFALDPVTRARMLSPLNRDLYDKQQQVEIEKLEQKLLMQNGDALEKIQDIALLTQRIQNNQDAYSRMAKSPEAAAVRLETQRAMAADAAYKLINQRNAESAVSTIKYLDAELKVQEGVSPEQRTQFVFKTLRKLHPTLLNIIEQDLMLPQYQQQVNDALGWAGFVSDIGAVISSSGKEQVWKDATEEAIDAIIQATSNESEAMTALEKAAYDPSNTQASEDVQYVLEGLKRLDRSRSATTVESEEQRKVREEANKQRLKAQEEDAMRAAKEAAAKAVVKSTTEEATHPVEEQIHKAQKNPENVIINKLEDVSLGEEKESIEDPDNAGEGTPSLEAQVRESRGEAQLSNNTTDVQTVNSIGEHLNHVSSTTLSGNAMSEYQPTPLQEEGRLVHKQGRESNDPMNKFYAWMNSAGIKLQNIIDTELSQILSKNPHAKVKFMTVTSQDNATHDRDMQSTLFLVLDYDDAMNKGITTIHHEDNGGVINSTGKNYLIIGVAGYGNKNVDKLALYDILFSNNPHSPHGYGLVKRGRAAFFKNNPSERFYVPEGLSTEIVPSSLIPGYIVKQTEDDPQVKFRDISELLEDAERNPHHLTLSSLVWGIQQDGAGFLITKPKDLVNTSETGILINNGDVTPTVVSIDQVMVPRAKVDNYGRAFVLFPASNGKYIPGYLKPITWNEIREGALKEHVENLLLQLTAPKYDTRLQAVKQLSQAFYMNSHKDFILIGKDGGRYHNQITLKRDGAPYKTFVLDSSFDRQQFMSAIAEMNPRINITTQVLENENLLKQYEEAGALQTDLAQLATAGSSYSIYGVDAQGNMAQPAMVIPDTNDSKSSTLRGNNKRQVVYDSKFYHYDSTSNTYTLNGAVVTDAETLTALDYNKSIVENGLTPVSTDGVWRTYVLGSVDHPDVIQVNKNNKKVRPVAEAQAKALLRRMVEEQAKKEREAVAIKALKEAEEKLTTAITSGEAQLLDVPLGTDSDVGEIIPEMNNLQSMPQKEAKVEEGNEGTKQQGFEDTVNSPLESTPSTQTFTDLLKSRTYRGVVLKAVRAKWPDAPKTQVQLEDFLRNKNIDVSTIGTTEAAVQAWLKTIEECR